MNHRIPQKVKKLIQEKEWYHQRFDGSPLYLYFIAEAELAKEPRKPVGTEANVRVSFFKDGKADWYLDLADVRRGSKVMIELAKKDPQIGAKLLKKWKKDELLAQKFFDNFNKINLKKINNKELLRLFYEYYRLFCNRFTSSAIIDHFALGTDKYIAELLHNEMGSTDKRSDFMTAFSIATAPVHQSFINRAEMDLLEITIKYPYNQKRLQAYQQKYFWINNNYITSKVLSVGHFRKEIRRWLKAGNIKSKYVQLKNASKNNAVKKIALFKKYKFSPLLKNLLKISEDFTWWQDERKKASYLNIYLGTNIVGEMARRIGYDKESTKFLLPREVATMFKLRKPTNQELKNRMMGSAFVVWRGSEFIATGQAVSELNKIMFEGKKRDVVKDIRGLTASVGRVVGPVKIVGSVKEVGKVQKGDILVAVMTRPDYIAGIRKAAAIVTNEGGITCHAAIVARELNIPCIIATKIATEVLKDGDVVEVNANHGVVTVLKKQ